MRSFRIVLWLLVVLAAGAFAYLYLKPAPAPQAQVSGLPLTDLGGPFTLVGADGNPFPSTRLAGKPYAIFFGFTNCPDVCPTTMARMVKLREQLGAGDQSFTIVFVTVDPERDGPTEVGTYAKAFNSPIVGLTGSPAQIEQVKKQYGIFSAKAPDDSGGYSVDHTATVLLFDRSGKFAATIAPDENDAPALEKLRRLL